MSDHCNSSGDDKPCPHNAPEFGHHPGKAVKVVVLPDGGSFISASSDYALRVFSLKTRECLYTLTGHSGCVFSIVVLGEDVVASSGEDGTIRVWRVSHESLLQTMYIQQEHPCLLASLGGGHIVISEQGGSFYEMVWDEMVLSRSGRQVTTEEGAGRCTICCIAVHKERFITCSEDGAVQVWTNSPFRCVTTIEMDSTSQDNQQDENHEAPSGLAIAISERWIARKRGVCQQTQIYDAHTFALKHTVSRTRVGTWKVLSVVLSNDNEHLVEIASDGLFVYRITTGEQVWSSAQIVLSGTLLPTGHILASSQDAEGDNTHLQILNPGPELALKVAPSKDSFECSPMETDPFEPLQDALACVLAGKVEACVRCRQLVRADVCSRSLVEWNSAHQLLMLAVREGDIPSSPDFENKKKWWLYQLYLPARSFTITAKEDESLVRTCLREAKLSGVIDNEDIVLQRLSTARDILNKIGLVRASMVRLCNRIVHNEDSVQTLKRTYEVFVRTKRISSAAGICLQLILFTGVSLEGIFSTEGAELTNPGAKRDVNNKIDTVSAADAQPNTYFTECLLRKLGFITSDRYLARLTKARKQRLNSFLEACGMSMDVLRRLYMTNRGTTTKAESDFTGYLPADGDIASSAVHAESDVEICEQVLCAEKAVAVEETVTACNEAAEDHDEVDGRVAVLQFARTFEHRLQDLCSNIAEMLQDHEKRNKARFDKLEATVESNLDADDWCSQE